MMVRKAVLGAAVASALGSLLASGVAFADEKQGKTAEKTVKCVGVNDCKGQNGCKGQGFTEMTEKACLQKGGTVEQPKPM